MTTDSTSEVSIGILGPTRSGKTNYLAVLAHYASDAGWRVRALDSSSEDFLARAHEAIVVRKEFLPPTIAGEIPTRYSFAVEPPRAPLRDFLGNRASSFRLGVLDVSGGHFERLTEIPEHSRDIIFNFLRECAGFLLLLYAENPSQPDLGLFRFLSSLFSRVTRVEPPPDDGDQSRRRSGPRPLAICFTRMDMSHLWEYRQQPLGLALRVFDHDTQSLVRNNYAPDTCEFFACSILGRTRDGRINYTQGRDGTTLTIVDTDEIHPFGIVEPLRWLLERFSPPSRPQIEETERRRRRRFWER